MEVCQPGLLMVAQVPTDFVEQVMRDCGVYPVAVAVYPFVSVAVPPMVLR